MNLIKKFLYTMRNFESVFFDLKSKQLNKNRSVPSLFEYFSEQIDLGLEKSLVDSEIYKIDNVIFQKIIETLILLRQKFYFLFSYKQKYYLSLLEEKARLDNLRESFENELDEEVDNLLNSKIVQSSGKYFPIGYNIEFKEGFEVINNKIEPIFANVDLLDTSIRTEGDSKIYITPSVTNFISKMTLSFKSNVKDKIVVAYKNRAGGNIVFTSDPIELSKEKSITLNFTDCAEILIYSNSAILKDIININVYGGQQLIDTNSSAAILSLEGNFEKLMFSSSDSIYFYKSLNGKIPDNLLNNDFKNNPNFEQITTNIFNTVNYVNSEKIIMVFNTDKPILEVPEIYSM